MRLLLVEDENKVAGFIKRGLEEEGYAVDLVSDGNSALATGLEKAHDLIILDINLPGMDGIEVLKALRQKKVATPVLLLTVRAAIEDRVIGLDTGADDYLTKPFAFEEFLARIRALLRRRAAAEPPVLRAGDLSLDPAKRLVMRADEIIELTSKEYALLEYLMRNQGRVLNRSMIADRVWGLDYDTTTNVIDVYVNYLRKKIDSGHEAKLIHTVRGVGYVLKAD